MIELCIHVYQQRIPEQKFKCLPSVGRARANLAVWRVRLVVGGGCCDPRLCVQINVIFLVGNNIQNIYLIKCDLFSVVLMYKNHVQCNKHLDRFTSANPPVQVSWLGCVPLPLQKAMSFGETFFVENLGHFASFWADIKVSFLLDQPWINVKVWGQGAGLFPHIWAYCPLTATKKRDKSSWGNKPIFRGNELTYGLWGNEGAIIPYVGQ